ncbi:MAG: mechanosensitive ion channel [Candidatus Bathyarchaeia archaeon]
MITQIGVQATTIQQFLLGAIAVLVIFLGVLHTLGIPAESLLVGATIASITIGLIILTFVGNILSGVFVFTTRSFRVGDDVMVNNIPGKIVTMTPIVTKPEQRYDNRFRTAQ